MALCVVHVFFFFFFNDTATTEIYTLSLHDALPIWTSWTAQTSGTSQHLLGVWGSGGTDVFAVGGGGTIVHYDGTSWTDRKSTRLNSSHGYISYAVFCLKKKKKNIANDDYNKYDTQT